MTPPPRPTAALVLAVVLAIPGSAAAEERVRHHLQVFLEPSTHRLAITDTIMLPAGASEVEFLLNAALTLTPSNPAVREVPLGDYARFFSINDSSHERLGPGRLKRYRGSRSADGTLTVAYGGTFHFPLTDPAEEYSRGFRETPGIVGPEGVYLSGSGYWYPQLPSGLVEFTLEAGVPAGWHLISQGRGTSRGEDGVARWDSQGPMDEIYLVGGPLQVYRDAAGAVETRAYLREKDDALAAKYLQTAAQYLELYRGLIGPYPFAKFAIVENFWETGYGMPSFTLLGPQVLRFPFILHSSYPHEILHNWWGNSVFVDYTSGNWCEGLTAYLADHLVQEQRGRGDEYRRATLQKYRSYVSAGRDFPLSEFRSRHSAATEAVGYGKALMGFHMLRRQMGDEVFRRLLARFYVDYRGRPASFRDIQKTAEAVSAKGLGWFFDPWITRAGAPQLAVSVSDVRAVPDGFEVSGRLAQVQGGEPFVVDVPVLVQTPRGATSAVVRLDRADTAFTLRTDGAPLVLHVDPQLDVFRRLDPREIPPSLGQLFGEAHPLALLPTAASADELRGYRALAEAWQSEAHVIEVKTDAEVNALPADRSVWLLGRTNRFASAVTAPGLVVGSRSLNAGGEVLPLDARSFVLVGRHPASVERGVGWIVADPIAALPGLARKLPHYGRYSYLGFEGEEPTNVLKGEWKESDSPLRVDLRPRAARGTPLPPLALAPRAALAEMPPVFSQAALLEHVGRLASPEMEGRGLGSRGLEAAASYIAGQFAAAGLEPAVQAFLQRFRVDQGEDGTPHDVANVIAVLPGTRPEWKDQSVLVTAHYDHLGRGGADAHAGDRGKVHPGADDNASGVAVLLELARAFAAGERPPRSLVFVAFTAEESGRLGSRYFAEHPTPFPLDKTRGVVNLDTVGRLGDQKLSVLGAGTASEWPHIFRGVGFVTGIESRIVPESLQASDEASFVERGVPAVQVFATAHGDYHRPGDTADKIDGPGLVKVATFVKEAVAYLAEREPPLTNTIRKESAAPPSPAPTPARRVSFGTVPDFSYPGPGVKVASVVPDSPADRAGVREGDVVIRIDDQEVANLRAFSDLLKSLAPGQTVRATVRRAGREEVVSVTVKER